MECEKCLENVAVLWPSSEGFICINCHWEFKIPVGWIPFVESGRINLLKYQKEKEDYLSFYHKDIEDLGYRKSSTDKLNLIKNSDKLGYGKIKCLECGSLDTSFYADYLFCFSCKNKKIKKK